MRLEALRFRGFPTFPDEVSIDFDALGDAVIVAVTGPNGEGKSTALELALAALDRKCPTRGKLGDLAKARDAFVEATVVNGSRYTIRQLVDAVSKKGEALVLDGAGAPVLDDTLLTTFKTWRETHLPNRDVLLASSFLAQGDGGILEMDESKRKAVILRALGIEYYEELAKSAGQRATAARERLVTATRAAAELDLLSNVAGAEENHRFAVDRAALAEKELADARRALADVEAEAASAAEAQRVAADISARRAAAVEGIAAAEKRIGELGERIRNNEAVLERAESVRAAVVRDAELAADIASAEQDLAKWSAKIEAATTEHARCTKSAGEAVDRAQRAQSRIERAKRSLAQKDVIEAAAERLRELDSNLAGLVTARTAAREALTDAQEERSVSSEVRVENLRKMLVVIRDEETCNTVDRARAVARTTIEHDDRLAQHVAETPTRLKALRLALEKAEENLGMAEEEARRLRPTAAVDLSASADELAEAERDLATAVEEEGRHLTAADAAEEVAEDAEMAAAGVDGAVRAMKSEREGLRATVQLAPRLDQAETRIAELQPQLDAARSELVAATESLAALPEPAPVPGIPDTSATRARAVNAEKAHISAAGSVAVFAERVEMARAASVRLAEVTAEQRVAETDLADWNHLAEAFGRDGLQALEIDAAGPEISALANDLLHTNFGPRFTVCLDTTKPDSKGHRELETFRITVLDTEKGHEGDGKEFSGGERVILNEALSLALTMIACRRSGLQGVTIFRDESGASLDPPKARAYVKMLRQAAAAVGASRILFVTHNADVVPLADARLHVEGGRIEVRSVQEVA